MVDNHGPGHAEDVVATHALPGLLTLSGATGRNEEPSSVRFSTLDTLTSADARQSTIDTKAGSQFFGQDGLVWSVSSSTHEVNPEDEEGPTRDSCLPTLTNP